MMRSLLLCLLFALITAACSKGYRVRVSNYYLERLDSVVVGNEAVIFTGIERDATTEYRNITSGRHSVRFVTSDGTRFFGEAPMPAGGSGDRTVQVDGLRQVVVLEDEPQ